MLLGEFINSGDICLADGAHNDLCLEEKAAIHKHLTTAGLVSAYENVHYSNVEECLDGEAKGLGRKWKQLLMH